MIRRPSCSLLGLALLLFITGPSAAHEGHPQPTSPFTIAEQHQPTPLPDRVLLTWAEDPQTTIDISWRTNESIQKSLVQFARGDQFRGSLLLGKVPGALSVAGTSKPFSSDLGRCQLHTARLTGLQPETMYGYRVGNGKYWSEWHQFRTASSEAKPFTFVYFGDAQNAIRSMWSRVIREANQHAPRAAFMLHAGDLINHANSDAEWGEWFGAGGWLNGMIPSVATPGNHEYDGQLTRHWQPQFSFPLNGPPGLEETVYWFDYQGARFISLNSNEQILRQAEWLKAVLTDPQRPKWTFVTFHHPVFSTAKGRDNVEVRENWRPLIERHGVDLVLQGHDHAYARSGLGGPENQPAENVPEGVRGKSSNTVYVVSVSGPKQYPIQDAWEVPRIASGVQLFQVIHVSPEKIRYEARLATGELYDAFELQKNAHGTTTLVEQGAELPEIRE